MSCERCQAMERELVALREKLAWAEGRRGQTGVCRARGFTPTETRILRKLAAGGMAFNASEDCLPRHISNIRAELKRQGVQVKIKTLVGQGYEVTSGREAIVALIQDTNPTAQPWRGSMIKGGQAIATRLA